MEGSPMMGYRYHVRSTSLPSTSHPLTARVEEQLNKLRCWVATSASSLHTTKMLQDGFNDLIDLYESVEDLLQLPNTQQVLVQHQDDKCVDKLLDGSVRLLDMSDNTRDVLLQLKEHVQQTESSLRRRRGEFDFRNEVESYLMSKKRINKVISKCLGDLKKRGSKHAALSLLNENHDLVAIVSVLREVESITIAVLEFLLFFVSGLKTKPRGGSLVSKLMHNKREICEGQHESGNEIVKADAAVLSLSSHKLLNIDNEVSNVQKKLEVLEASIESLEEELECIFKRLIKTRVSLLNILSN